MLEEKKRRASQTPAWRQIEHHDHPAPRADSSPGAAPDTAAPAPLPVGPRVRGDRGGD
jgi:hypothetical protein